jgi:hypothetical protein
MDHEPSPLFDTDMPKTKPIAKLMDTYLKSNPLMKATNNKLKHTDYQPPQGILRPCTGDKNICVDLEI